MGANDQDLETIFQVRIPRQYKEKLEAKAQELNLSMSALARYALKEYLYGVPAPFSAAVLAPGDGGEEA